MKKLRTVLVDDEPLALRLLEHELAGLESVEIVAICKNGKEALTAISDHEPDMVFLDVQMPGLNGFDVVKNLQSDTMPMIVFVTAYDQFALAAFEIHAVDYLLKPLDSSRLARAVDRAVERLCSSASVVTSDETKSQLISVISSISDKVNQLNGDPHLLDSSVGLANSVRRIPIKDGDTITVIDESSIDWIDAAGDYMCIHVGGVTHIMRSTMSVLLARLDQNVFKRIHRSTVVNVTRIKRIQRHQKGDFFLHLECDQALKASRHYRDVIKDLVADI